MQNSTVFSLVYLEKNLVLYSCKCMDDDVHWNVRLYRTCIQFFQKYITRTILPCPVSVGNFGMSLLVMNM